MIALSSASQSVAIFVVLPLAPRLLARWGFVRTTPAGIVGAVAMLLSLPLFPNIDVWVPTRFVLGASTVMFYTACSASAALSSPYVAGGIRYGIGSIAGPLLGRLLRDAAT